MWNMGNMENMDYGQMGITEDYLMWFSFMYGLQSDYYLFLLIPTSRYLYLVRSGHLLVSYLSFLLSRATSNVCPTSLPVALLVHTPTFIGIRHRFDMHTVTSD